MWQKHKGKIIAAIVVVAVLAAAFLMGGDLGETKEPAKVPEPEISQEVVPEAPVEPEETPEQAEPVMEEQPETEKLEAETPEEPMEETPAEEQPAMEINPETGMDRYNTEPVPEGMPIPVEPQDAEVTDAAYTCTFSISCATILNNMDLCAEEKVELVPADGWILQPVTVTFYEGESVFDVLLRLCQEQKIHMEYMDTPMYNSAYIEGIANLYEFDVGALSGWMYSVNGWFPNYGCSRYALQDGDAVNWVYTCDLGADVGGDLYGQNT